jgi:hypothetical protein
MIDRLHGDDPDLLALDEGRHRNDERELLRRALVVARHGDRRGLAVAGEHDLGGPVEQLGVGTRHVEPAERRRRAAGEGKLSRDAEQGR